MLSLATSPATNGQRLQLISIAGILIAAWLLASVIAAQPFYGLDLGWALLVAQLMTAYLLFSQLFAQRSPAIAVIAAAFVFTVILYNVPVFWLSAKLVHPASLLQATRAHAWIVAFAHAGFPLFFLAYAIFDNYLEHITLTIAQALAIAAAVVVAMFALALGLGMLAIAFEAPLSVAFGVDGARVFGPGSRVLPLAFALGAISLVVFVIGTRLRTLTQAWLALSLLAGILDTASVWLVHGSRFTAGTLIAQVCGLIACIAIPALYVFEFHWIYARLLLVSDVLRHQALVDEVTGIGNRRHFDMTIDIEWRRAMRAGTPVTLIVLDFDKFSAYGDALGYVRAEETLRRVARTLEKRARRAGDLVTRYRDDKFALILPDVDAEKAAEYAHVLSAEVAALRIAHPRNERSAWVTLSVGHATLTPAKGQPLADLVDAAAGALEATRRSGAEVPAPL